MTMTTRLHVPTAGRRRAGGWVLVAAEFGFAVLYVVCAYLAFARAAELTGQWYVPAQNDVQTADLDITGGWPWAALVMVVVSSGFIVALLAFFVSLIVLLSGYAKGRPRLTTALIASTVTMVLLLVVTLTPAATSLSGWLLD